MMRLRRLLDDLLTVAILGFGLASGVLLALWLWGAL
jgi:hypothetical protein